MDYELQRIREIERQAVLKAEQEKEELDRKRAEDAAKKRSAYIQAAVGAAVGASVTLLVEHFSDIVRFFSSLFH